MLDIIIPSYNDEQGLYSTLFSLGTINYNWQVFIIDDASTENIDFKSISNLFSKYYPIHIIKSPNNVGPGGVREYGLILSQSEFITFIDCGDIVLLPQLIKKFVHIMEKTPSLNVISCAHLEEPDDNGDEFDKTPETHNRMHGKIYRKSFLTKYNIHFNIEYPRANEDIGFNHQCRFIDKYFNLHGIMETAEPLILQTNNPTSITRFNKCEFIYKNQNIGLAKNVEFAITNIQKNFDPPIQSFLPLIYDVFGSMYTNYLNTVISNKEYENDSLLGAKYFYDKYGYTFDLDTLLFAQIINHNIWNSLSNAEILYDSIDNIPIKEFIQLLKDKNDD